MLDIFNRINPSVTCLRPILLLLALSAGRLPGAESVDLGKLQALLPEAREGDVSGTAVIKASTTNTSTFMPRPFVIPGGGRSRGDHVPWRVW